MKMGMVTMVRKIKNRVEEILPGFEVRVEYGDLKDLAVIKIMYPLPSGGYVSEEINCHNASEGILFGRVMTAAQELLQVAYEDYEQHFHREAPEEL